MEAQFYDRLRVYIRALERDYAHRATVKDWHKSLRSLLRDRHHGKPIARTTRDWIADARERRRIPHTKHAGVIVHSLKLYRDALARDRNKEPKQAIADEVLDLFFLDDVPTLAGKLALTAEELFKTIPELRALSQYVGSDAIQRVSDECRATNSRILDNENSLDGKSFYLYRLAAIAEGPMIHRDVLSFKSVRSGAIQFQWDLAADVSYTGSTFISEDIIYALATKRTSPRNFEMAFICIRQNVGEKYWPAIFTGLTDGGHSPCAGRGILHDASTDKRLKEPAIVAADEWSKLQMQLASKILRVDDNMSKEDHCVVFDRNWLARLFKEMSRHKEKWQT